MSEGKELKSKKIFIKMKDKPLTVRRCKEVLLSYGKDEKIRKKFINELERLSKQEAFSDVHSLIADWYDEELERNRINAVKNLSRVTVILKERIGKLEKELGSVIPKKEAKVREHNIKEKELNP